MEQPREESGLPTFEGLENHEWIIYELAGVGFRQGKKLIPLLTFIFGTLFTLVAFLISYFGFGFPERPENGVFWIIPVLYLTWKTSKVETKGRNFFEAVAASYRRKRQPKRSKTGRPPREYPARDTRITFIREREEEATWQKEI